MFRKLCSFKKNAFSNHFGTHYSFQDSVFNFALTVNGKNILDGDKLQTTETVTYLRIAEAYQKGISNIFIRLKDNNDENDVSNIVSQIKKLQQKYPDLKIQGLRYPMTFNQKTVEFLHNEFLFGLKAAQLTTSKLHPLIFFITDSNEVLKSALSEETKASYEKALFNFDVLSEATKSLEFSNLVYTINYDKDLTTPENLKKFFEVFKKRDVAFDLELNKAFIKEPQQDKRKNTADFIKYAYGFEPHIRAVTLYDFNFESSNKAVESTGTNDSATASSPISETASNEATTPNEQQTQANGKQGNASRAPIGEGLIDFKLVFDMVKVSNFRGALILPSDATAAEMDTVINWAKQYEFNEKTEDETLQYIAHKEQLRLKKPNGQGGIEYMPV